MLTNTITCNLLFDYERSLIQEHKGYRNTIVGSSHGERMFIYFWKNKVRLKKKLNFLIFLNFLLVKMTLNGLEFCLQKTNLLYFYFYVFIIFVCFIFLELLLNEPAVILRY